MSTLTGQKIKDTYDGLLKTTDSTQGLPTTGVTTIEDGLGNDSALNLGRTSAQINGNLDVSNNLVVDGDVQVESGITAADNIASQGNIEGSNFKLNAVIINKFVTEADGIAANDNDTSIPTSAAVKDYVDNVPVDDLSTTLAEGNSTDGNNISITEGDKITNFTSDGINDNATQTRLTITNTGLAIGVTPFNPNRQLHVDGNSRFNGNILADKNTSKIGIRVYDPQYPLEVEGEVRFTNLSVGSRTSMSGNTKRIHTGELQIDNQQYIQFSDYGRGDLSSMDPQTNMFQQTTASFSGNGRLMEDWTYKWIRIKPSWWGTQSEGEYKEYTILTAPNDNSFVLVDEILVIDNKDPFGDNRKGNFVGPDEDPWLGFYNDSGAEIYERQIAAVSLGTYRKEAKKWSYLMRSNENVQPNNDYHTTVQRSGNTVVLKARTLNNATIRPNYNVEFRIKYKTFKLLEQTGFYPTTLQ
jgi:cytoskeletal protein CcmA (bactofilin family)